MLGRARRSLDDRGFTLIELLVVVGIIGILAAVAIPVFLHQKARGYEAQVKSDVQNLAKQVELAFADGAATVTRIGNTLSDGTTSWPITVTQDVSWNAHGTPGGYCLVAWSDAGGKYTPTQPLVYDSTAGGLTGNATCGEVPDLPPHFLGGAYTPPPPAPQNRMVLVYDLSLGCTDRQLRIPTGGTPAGTIDWGDGTTAEPLTALATHTYATVGTYTVTLTGTIPSYGSSTTSNQADNVCLTSVPEWGPDTGTTSISYAFAQARNLIDVAAPPPTVRAMAYTFREATRLTTLRGTWDTSNVTDMRYAFYQASAFNHPIGTWDTSKVAYMDGMFSLATSFNQPIGNWNTATVMKLNSMFREARAFNQPIGTWDTSRVNETSTMFYNATSFDQPLAQWDTSNVTSMTSMFSGATSFTHDLSTWNVAKVTARNYFGVTGEREPRWP